MLRSALGLVALFTLVAAASAGATNPGFAYSPATWPQGTVGKAYDTTMSVTYNGQPATLDTPQSRTSATEAFPGVLIKTVKVNGNQGLELVGTPTQPGTFTFQTCVNDQGNCADPESWKIVVTGSVKAPAWIARAKAMRASVDSALTAVFKAVGLVQKDQYAKAKAELVTFGQELSTAQRTGTAMEPIIPPGSPVRVDAAKALDDVETALNLGDHAYSKAGLADIETGEKELEAKNAAIKYLDRASESLYAADAALKIMINTATASASP